jgi:hypothetical protein
MGGVSFLKGGQIMGGKRHNNYTTLSYTHAAQEEGGLLL